MKGKLIAGLIVSAVIVIGAIFTVSSIDSTKPDVINKVVASEAVTNGNKQGQVILNNDTVGNSSIEKNNNGATNQIKNSSSTSGTTNIDNSPNEFDSTNLTKSNSGKTQYIPRLGAHVNNMNKGLPMSVSSNSSSTNKSNNENPNIISYNVPSGIYSSSTILVKNTTGQPVSIEQLNEYLRSWIMSSQKCRNICDATGTYWERPWLNKVSQKTLYQAFVEANGQSALSQSITANEFIKATQKLDDITENNVPFTLLQAKSLILQMLQKDGYATPSDVTKIVLVKTSDDAYYEVYTKESGNSIFWIVYANSGYAHGTGTWY